DGALELTRSPRRLAREQRGPRTRAQALDITLERPVELTERFPRATERRQPLGATERHERPRAAGRELALELGEPRIRLALDAIERLGEQERAQRRLVGVELLVDAAE